MRSTGLICAVAAMAGALGAVSVGSAEAAVPGGCTSRGNYHAGATSAYNSSVYGARARIEYNNPDLCGSDTNGGSASVVWSMVTAHSATYPSNSSRNGWAQSGYGQFAQAQGSRQAGFMCSLNTPSSARTQALAVGPSFAPSSAARSQ